MVGCSNVSPMIGLASQKYVTSKSSVLTSQKYVTSFSNNTKGKRKKVTGRCSLSSHGLLVSLRCVPIASSFFKNHG